MPNDSDFTLSLFDSTALSGRHSSALHAVTELDEADLNEADEAETDEDDGTPQPVATPVAQGNNFHLAGERELARGWPARARDNMAGTNQPAFWYA